jgi:nanoRNase/pAp phosphatase (c-di-AMP/oligoRNAs hydrolase)/Trk K+ transport system NAD-binding subunit
MVVRLVLGSGSLGTTIAESLADRPGSLQVVTDQESRVKTLREAGISVADADPTDPASLRALATDPDFVAVVDEDRATNLDAARAARRTFPEAYVWGYVGADSRADAADEWRGRERAGRDGEGAARGVDVDGAAGELSRFADRVVDPTADVARSLLDRVGPEGVRQRQLLTTLRTIDRLAIVTHENPDPDAIGSAVALSRIAESVGCDPVVCYYGDITHQENRAFVNLLAFDLRRLDPGEDLTEFDGFALVDHSRPGVNDGLPRDLEVDVVVDHHPPRAPVEARFVDLRSDVGATSTLLVEYLQHFGVEMTEDVATGLLFGIRVDTKEFTREVSPADFEAAAAVLPHADLGTLERVETPSMSPETLATIASAIRNRQRQGSILLSSVGRLTDRDALAQAADRLLELEGVATTVVYGVSDGVIYVSARARGRTVDLGEALRNAFGQIGSAGGHADMAGAQITLGVLEAVEDRDESLLEIVEAVVSDRFLEALEARSDTRFSGTHIVPLGAADEYLVPAEDREPLGEPGRESESPTDRGSE